MLSTNWNAKWIWPVKKEESKNIYVEFRRKFELQSKAKPLKLHISARNEYVLNINGTFLGRGPSPCDSDWQYYDTYERSDEMFVCG